MSWQQLIKIRDEARAMRQEDMASPLIDCPECGMTLQVRADGLRNCPMGHYRTRSTTKGALA